MKLEVASQQEIAAVGTLSLRCPFCREIGILNKATLHDGRATGGLRFGPRRCPKPECRSLVFVIHDGAKVVASYPPSRLDFDSTNVPAAVAKALEEAIACHASECYIAAAIMVRKTLEELCRDRQATGKNLKDRIKALQGKVVLPQELLDGVDELRLLGNDAAHVESQEFNQVGRPEVEVGIEFAKEVLKAVYQYSSLLGRLRALKKP